MSHRASSLSRQSTLQWWSARHQASTPLLRCLSAKTRYDSLLTSINMNIYAGSSKSFLRYVVMIEKWFSALIFFLKCHILFVWWISIFQTCYHKTFFIFWVYFFSLSEPSNDTVTKPRQYVYTLTWLLHFWNEKMLQEMVSFCRLRLLPITVSLVCVQKKKEKKISCTIYEMTWLNDVKVTWRDLLFGNTRVEYNWATEKMKTWLIVYNDS